MVKKEGDSDQATPDFDLTDEVLHYENILAGMQFRLLSDEEVTRALLALEARVLAKKLSKIARSGGIDALQGLS